MKKLDVEEHAKSNDYNDMEEKKRESKQVYITTDFEEYNQQKQRSTL